MNINEYIIDNRLKRIETLLNATSSVNNKKKRERVYTNFKAVKLERKLRIAYVMNHTRVCGGAKIILEHTNQLVDRGHEVFIISRDAKPDWKEIKAKYIQALQQSSFVQSIPDVDIIVCTVADQVPECYLLGNAPVILFEQGDVYIYEFDKIPQSSKEFYQKIWRFPIPVVGVSKVLMDTLDENFGCKGKILHNALNDNYFYPPIVNNKPHDKLKVLFVGQENNHFKGISIVREALKIVRRTGREFDEVWVSQTTPKSQFDGELVINPSQEQLGEIYRSSDIFISGSYYESFPLPPLEAMTCGCAVISTDNEGIKEYGIDGVNCVLGKIGNPDSLASCLIDLIDNEEKRKNLIKAGYLTSEKFKWEKIMVQWEEYLFGAIKVWESEEVSPHRLLLRVEKLPVNLNDQKMIEYMNKIQEGMPEEWCLWLTEGEEIEEGSILYLQRLLSLGLDVEYGIQINYPCYVFNTPLVRVENRLMNKKKKYDIAPEEMIVLPIQISKSSSFQFISNWMRELRNHYLNHRFDTIIKQLNLLLSQLSKKDQVIAIKWLVKCLIETRQYKQAIEILNKAFLIAPSYTDFYYLAAEIYVILGQDTKKLTELINTFGPSLEYNETFLSI
ncbi:glycosyltransferase [Bacillus cytotoxicus]|uniref:Predicted glycosyltransferases n=1 Tax=Bacillus cytotoxicus TaxID=580165 RepID=A0AAX2CF48_9BACI|nr:glycosyltransferase [Bacillus cytotoxicus]QTR82617.1 glycosyltransferase [Bacillus cytotoxicus]QTR86355.1 glycosyltransferase [Bacillus cytotoxicus]SCL89323.1 Predicted glycosyltransferases [Bacillus cytotoxicus]